MSKFILEIKTDNAAFDELEHETVRILEDVIDDILYHDRKQGSIRDLNGNTVGSYKFTGDS